MRREVLYLILLRANSLLRCAKRQAQLITAQVPKVVKTAWFLISRAAVLPPKLGNWTVTLTVAITDVRNTQL